MLLTLALPGYIKLHLCYLFWLQHTLVLKGKRIHHLQTYCLRLKLISVSFPLRYFGLPMSDLFHHKYILNLKYCLTPLLPVCTLNRKF